MQKSFIKARSKLEQTQHHQSRPMHAFPKSKRKTEEYYMCGEGEKESISRAKP